MRSCQIDGAEGDLETTRILTDQGEMVFAQRRLSGSEADLCMYLALADAGTPVVPGERVKPGPAYNPYYDDWQIFLSLGGSVGNVSHKIGAEGWSLPDPPTIEGVRKLEREVYRAIRDVASAQNALTEGELKNLPSPSPGA